MIKLKKVSEFNTERELQKDLAEYLRCSELLTFTEIQIPGMGGSRADIITVSPHKYSTKDIRIYEVKLTRSAWLADKKYQKYLECCNRMYLACPKGVINRDEVPKEIGLITRNDNGWTVLKAPKLNINPSKINVDFVLSLLYRGYEESRTQRDLRDRIVADSNATLKEQAEKIGRDIARRLDKTKEAQIENWCIRLWEIFNKYGYEMPKEVIKFDLYFGERVNLPSLCDLEQLLGGVSSMVNDVAAIKAIGEYLKNIEYPEEEDKYFLGSRKVNREKALKLINNEEGNDEKLMIKILR